MFFKRQKNQTVRGSTGSRVRLKPPRPTDQERMDGVMVDLIHNAEGKPQEEITPRIKRILKMGGNPDAYGAYMDSGERFVQAYGALELAASGGLDDVVEVLLAAGAHPWKPIVASAQHCAKASELAGRWHPGDDKISALKTTSALEAVLDRLGMKFFLMGASADYPLSIVTPWINVAYALIDAGSLDHHPDNSGSFGKLFHSWGTASARVGHNGGCGYQTACDLVLHAWRRRVDPSEICSAIKEARWKDIHLPSNFPDSAPEVCRLVKENWQFHMQSLQTPIHSTAAARAPRRI